MSTYDPTPEQLHMHITQQPMPVRHFEAYEPPPSNEMRKNAERYLWLRSVGAERGVIDWAALQVNPHDLAAMDCVIDASIHIGVAAAEMADAPGAA